MGETILITGGTGFAGSHLVEALKAAGKTPHVTTASGNAESVAELIPADHIHQVDLTARAAVDELIQTLQPTQIYHLAAFAVVGTSFDMAQSVLENNVELQVNLLDAIKQHAPKARLLVVGSGMEYDTLKYPAPTITEEHPLGPISPYAVSKVMQDLLSLSYAYTYKLDIVRARPFNHIGERQTADFAVPAFAKQIAAIERGEQVELKVGNLQAIRDFTDVKDVSRAYILLMDKGENREVYNIGSGIGYSMEEVLGLLCQQAQVEITVTTDQEKMRPLDVPSVVADIARIQSLGWTPQIPLKDSLSRVLQYWRDYP